MSESAAASPAPIAEAVAPEVADEGAAPERTTLQEATQTFAEKMKAAKAAKKAGRAALEAVAEPEKSDVKAAPKPGDVEELTAEALFAPEALETPEGIAKAREVLNFAKEHLEKRHRNFDRADMRLKEREKVVAGNEQKNQQIAQYARAFQGELQIITGLRESDPLGIMRSLDKVSGGNGSAERGLELFEAMAAAYAREGKLPAKSRDVIAMEQQIEALKRERQREREEMTEQQKATQLAGVTREVQQMEAFAGKQANNPAQFPMVSAWVAEGRGTEADVGKYIGDLMEAQPGLDLASAIGILESRLAPLGAKRAPQGESVSGETESPRVAAPARKNGARQSTVLPSDADRSSGTTRIESDEERRARLARTPAFMKKLGIGHLLES